MQYRDYIFEHNPTSIVIEQTTRTASHLCPGLGETSVLLGRSLRRAICNGSFFGNSLQETRKKSDLFRSATAVPTGMLLLPGYPPFIATLESFSINCQSDGKIMPYTMVFVEEESF